MTLPVWPPGPLRRLLGIRADERRALAEEHAAEQAALVAEIERVRREGEREREALKDAMEYVAAEFNETRARMEYERDILVFQRDGLAPVVTDLSIAPERRIAVCQQAILRGRIAEVVSLFETMADDPRHRPTAARGLALCRHLLKSGLLQDLGWSPPAGTEDASPVAQPFRYSPQAAGRKVVLVFLGVGTRFWMQVSVMQQFLAPFGHHVLYLRDSQWACFMRGVDGVGSSYETALTGLSALCRTLSEGEPQIFCLGTSMGGFGALRYGLDLGAHRVLAIETITSLKGDINRAQDEKVLSKMLGDLAVDLKPLYLRQAPIPQVTLYYGALNARDAAHAERFADVPGACVVPVADSGDHHCLAKLIAEERFPQILTEFLSDVS